MNKLKYTPYNFNEKYEYKTYVNIGSRYRSSVLGKKQKENSNKYSDLNNYTSWKNYFINKYLKKSTSDSNCNFMHYLISKMELKKMILEIIKVIAIPAYILEITIFVTALPYKFNNLYMLNKLIMILCFLIIIGVFFITKNSRKLRFYKDCIDIINNYIISH